MQVNVLPLMMVPGITALSWTLSGLPAVEDALGAWAALIAGGTALSIIQHARRLPTGAWLQLCDLGKHRSPR